GGGSDSWGFAGAGTGVSKSNCDTGSVSPELRLCWHTPTSGVVNSGYRCGSTTSTGATYERLIFHAD
ncbi:MAG: hypothetical protein KDK45_18845, partial [Leptospiraceae bacterium]|nr:hypothetical protein [Leptospiraceae bacterium]